MELSYRETWALIHGNSRPSITLDTYSHVRVDDREIDRAAYLPLFHVGG